MPVYKAVVCGWSVWPRKKKKKNPREAMRHKKKRFDKTALAGPHSFFPKIKMCGCSVRAKYNIGG